MLFKNIFETWKFDLDILTGFLSFDKDISALQNKKRDSKLFVEITKKNIINNQHSVVVELYPDPSLAQRKANVSGDTTLFTEDEHMTDAISKSFLLLNITGGTEPARRHETTANFSSAIRRKRQID